MKKLLTALLTLVIVGYGCRATDTDRYVSVKDGHFTSADNESEYFIGANFWYGAVLGSEGVGGNRERLLAELDMLKDMGVTNLRVLVGGDGPDGVPTRVTPTLQKEPQVYNDTLFRGLDYLLAEMGRRDMKAVLYLNNAWEWSGGYGIYLEWAGEGKALIPAEVGYPAYTKSVSKFVTSQKAKALFADHVRTVVSRTNTVTGIPYSEDPAIFSWQISNEPRCFSSDPSVKEAFTQWMWETAALIKSLDPNHMVSSGNEGAKGCEEDIELFEKIHACPDIDYVNIHIWPFNWSWIKRDSVVEGLENAISETDKYIDAHLAVAAKYNKPMVIEEFGYPRDGFQFSKSTPVSARDAYYKHIFDRVVRSSFEGGLLAGVNFWGWGGMAEQSQEHIYWEAGDDYCGDPAQEQQGLNSVYASDAGTVGVIRKAVSDINRGIIAEAICEHKWMYEGAGRHKLAVNCSGRKGAAAELTLSLSKDTGEPVSTNSQSIKILRGGVTQPAEFGIQLEAGFYRAALSLDGEAPFSEFNIGCDPENIDSPQDKQPDFDRFWASTLAELAEVPVNARLTLLPDHSNDIRRTYRVDMLSWGETAISGILVEPVKAEKYPVFINYMGYNAQLWYPDPSSRPDAAEFTLCVRDQALNKPADSTEDWVTWGLESKDTYYYRGAFADVVRAVDFVCSLPKADPNRIFAEGGSQGGAFTLVSASLDKRIKAIAPFVPFLSDFPDYFKIAEWPGNQVLAAAAAKGIPEEDLYKTLSYFDIKNFTDRIECPVLMGFGLQDPVCPPHTNFAGFNRITTQKSWICFPFAGHQVEREDGWWQARDEFFSKFL